MPMMDAVRGSPSDAAAAGGNSEKHSDMFVYFIIGVACAAVLLAGLLLVMHLQLRQAHQHLEKEKNIWGGPSTGGGLRGMWARARGAGRGAVRNGCEVDVWRSPPLCWQDFPQPWQLWSWFRGSIA